MCVQCVFPAFRRLAACRSGVTAVEFAILAPVFLAMFLGMVAFGIHLAAAHSLQQIAADATRTAIAGLDLAERRALATSFVDANASSYPFIDRESLAFSVLENPDNPNQFTVSVLYDARTLPIWNLMKGLPMPPTEIRRVSTIRVGGL